MELRHIRYFLAIAAEHNFTRAAEKLGIAQPPLSQQIRSLEDELGVQLFHRVPHGAELTAAGEAFLVEAQLAAAAAERAKLAASRAHRGEIGRLLLGFTTSAMFNPVINSTVDAFHHAYPDVILALTEATTLQLYERLLRGDLDAAFVRPGVNDPAGVQLHHLESEAMVIALPANHRLAARDRLPLTELAAEPFVLFPRVAAPSLYDEVVKVCRDCGFTPHIAQEATVTASIIVLVAAHLGVSVVPKAITQLRLEGVAYRAIEGPAPVARLALARPKGVRSPMTQNFVGLLP